MLIVAFGESTKSRTQVQLWYWKAEDDDALPSRQSTSTADENIETVKKMIVNNRRITTREVADDVGISFGSCQCNFCRCFRHETCNSEDYFFSTS